MSPSESTFHLPVFVYSTPIVSFYLSLLPGHTARWCKMLFPFPHVLVLTSGDSSLLFCSCVAGFLPCFSYDRSICTLSLDSLFLTLEKFQPWDWFWYPLTCGPRGAHGADISIQIFALVRFEPRTSHLAVQHAIARPPLTPIVQCTRSL